MKKSLIAGASALALGVAVIPAAGVFAADVTEQVDTLNVTISPTCTMASVTHAGTGGTWGSETTKDTLTATVTAGAAVELGSTTFNIKCNNQSGWNVSAVATDLVGQTTNTQKIPVGTTAENTAAWKYVSSTENTDVTAGKTNTNPVANASKTTGNDGHEFKMTYTVSTDTLLSAQAYEGTITYTLASGAYNAGS